MTDFEEIFRQIAKDMNTTAAEVKSKIEEIAKNGLQSNKAKEKHFWLQVPKKGKYPTAEEIISFLSLVAYHSEEAVLINDES